MTDLIYRIAQRGRSRLDREAWGHPCVAALLESWRRRPRQTRLSGRAERRPTVVPREQFRRPDCQGREAPRRQCHGLAAVPVASGGRAIPPRRCRSAATCQKRRSSCWPNPAGSWEPGAGRRRARYALLRQGEGRRQPVQALRDRTGRFRQVARHTVNVLACRGESQACHLDTLV